MDSEVTGNLEENLLSLGNDKVEWLLICLWSLLVLLGSKLEP